MEKEYQNQQKEEKTTATPLNKLTTQEKHGIKVTPATTAIKNKDNHNEKKMQPRAPPCFFILETTPSTPS
ncbi:hypothetical protein [Serratia sp. Z4]|uniref:hypothetical protein n=1 Tax=Serratia sp. Z4 TaxID=2738127 RepID=UPI00135CD979|nr:hypothetical protein [Serratia sp. Z4]